MEKGNELSKRFSNSAVGHEVYKTVFFFFINTCPLELPLLFLTPLGFMVLPSVGSQRDQSGFLAGHSQEPNMYRKDYGSMCFFSNYIIL